MITVILEWCVANERILLTHDVNTMTKFAYERLIAGEQVTLASASSLG